MFFSAKEIINIPPLRFSFKICHYLYSNDVYVVIPPPQPALEDEEEQIIHCFEVELEDLGEENQPLLQEGDDSGRESESKSEPPLILCIICMEEEAVIIVLVCGHIYYCLNCVHLFEEGRNKHCPICRERVLCLFRIYY